MTTTVRYKMANDTKYLFLSYDGKDKISISPDNSHIYFVDILDSSEYFSRSCSAVKVRMFFPDGEIKTGWVMKDYIQLNNQDMLFDGRFNSDRA